MPKKKNPKVKAKVRKESEREVEEGPRSECEDEDDWEVEQGSRRSR